MELQYASSDFAERLLFSIKTPRNAKITPIAAQTYQRRFRLRGGTGTGAAVGGGVAAVGTGVEGGGGCGVDSIRGIAIVAVAAAEPGSSAARSAPPNSEQLPYRASGVLASALRRTPSPTISTAAFSGGTDGGPWIRDLGSSRTMVSAATGR